MPVFAPNVFVVQAPQAVSAGLAQAACQVLQTGVGGDYADLVRVLTSNVPTVVVLAGQAACDAATLAALAAWVQTPGAAGLLLLDDAVCPALPVALWPWLELVVQPLELPARLELARQRADLARQYQERSLALAGELAQLHTQLDERKWVDRAKGLLMSARGMAEDEAFRLLRGAAMHANLRMGEVSRSVIESAQWADAINRAGQLRMLSQRLVKLAAQRLLGVDARRARTLQHQASRRAQDNLDHLAHLAPLQKSLQANPAVLLNALAAATQAWATLKEALEARQTAAALLGTDAQAEALLQAAETLTDALETHGARRALHIINLCGRQRMRSQRLAKEALLATLPGQEARALRLGSLLDDFEAALLELERAPLSTPDTRTMLAQARDEWLRLLRGLRSAEGDEGRAALAGSADALLDLFDQLTNAYEHSLQVLMA